MQNRSRLPRIALSLSLSLSLEDILEKVEEYDLNHSKELTNLEEFYIQHNLINKVNWEECCKGFSDQNHRFTLIIITLRNLKNNPCRQCQNPLKNNSYFYYPADKTLIKWEINQITKFSGRSTSSCVLFCSEDCFKRSSYSEKITKSNETAKEQNSSDQSKKPSQTINATQRAKNTRQSNEEDYCAECYNKFPKKRLLCLETTLSSHFYCPKCFLGQKAKQEKFEKEWDRKMKNYCQSCRIELLGKEDETNIHCAKCWKKYLAKVNRQEINMQAQKTSNSNLSNPNLNSQITQLKKEISSLESSSDKNLLNSKKQELAELEKGLKEQQTEPKGNSKLWIGVGCGVVGVGLVGMVVWLILRGKKE